MVDLTKYIPGTKFNTGNTITAPSETEGSTSLMKYIDTGDMGKVETPITNATSTTNNNLLKYVGREQEAVVPQEKTDWLTPDPKMWWNKPAKSNQEWDKLTGWQKANLVQQRGWKDLSVSIPTIGYGLLQWPVQAHRQTLEEGLQGPQVSPTKKLGISKKYTQGGGIGYLPSLIYNMLIAPGQEVVEQLGTQEGRKGIGQSFQQHPFIGPLGTAAALALPLLVAKGFIPKGKAFPLAAKEGLYSPKAPPEPSILSKYVSKAAKKFMESERGMKFKEHAGLLKEQQEYYRKAYDSELKMSEALSEQGRSELYNSLRKLTKKEQNSFIDNLELAKPKTAEAAALYEKAGIKIPKATTNVVKALELWKKHSAEGMKYMMEQTEGTLFKGGARSKLLTKSALARGAAEFKIPVIEEAKSFRVLVKKMGGLSEEAAKPYKGLIPKDLITKNKVTSKVALEVINKEITKLNDKISTIVERNATEMAKISVKPEKLYLEKLQDIKDYIRESGGIKYSKDMAGEYKKLPFDLKAKKGYVKASTLDEMAMDIGNAFPEHGIKSGADLIKVLKDLRTKGKIGYKETFELSNKELGELYNDLFEKDFQKQTRTEGFKKLKTNSIADLVLKKEELQGKLEPVAEVGKGLSLEEIATQLKVTPEEVLSKLRKFSEMKQDFNRIAIEKMTKKFGYKVPIGSKPGVRQLNKIESARWQPTIQALEKKLGTKFTIEEIRDLFEEPGYYHHTWPRDFKFTNKAYTGPSYSPGFWKERAGATGYSKEVLKSVSNYDYQLNKYKALNEFKDIIFDKFGEILKPKDAAQASQIRQGNLIKYGKGKVLWETPDGQMIKVKTDIVVPRTIANELNVYFEKTGRFEAIARAYIDPVTNAWKIPVLALSPRWVVNNILGNFILNTIGGTGIGGYLDAIGITGKAFKLMREAKKNGTPMTFLDGMVKAGVPERVAQGLYRGEVMGVREPLPVTGMEKAAKVAKYIPEKVYTFNSAVESFFRTAHYMDKIGKGFDLAQATASVNEFLFDYARMSKIQKQVFRRIDPFIAWHKNITRLALSFPVNYPQRFMFLQFANKIGMENYDEKLREAGVNPDDVKDYYKNMFILPWKDENGDDFYISLRGLDPLQDMLLSMETLPLHPALKVGIERMTGVNTFTKKPFTSPYTIYGSKEKVTPPLWRHILSQWPQFRIIEDVARPYSTYDTGEPMVDKRGEPIYTKNKLLGVMGILGFSVKPRDIDRIYEKIKDEEKSKEKRKNTYERALDNFKRKQELGY